MKGNSSQRQLISQHKGNIIHLKTLTPTKNIITSGTDGQLHLYRKHNNQQNYEHISCLKLFQSAVVACDVSKNQQQSILVAAFSGQIKICHIVDGTFIIVEKQLLRLYDSPIMSCIWSYHPNHLIVSTQLGSLYVIDYKQNSLLTTYQEGQSKSKSNLSYVRKGDQRLFFNYRNKIFSFEYHLNEKKVSRRTILKLSNDILDFIVSDQTIFSTLAILTQPQLAIYLLAERQPVKMSVFKLEQHSIGRKLGWGANYSQLVLYHCVQGKIKTNLFTKKLNGRWNSDYKESKVIVQNNGIQMKDIQ